jgi:hypothetical protein
MAEGVAFILSREIQRRNSKKKSTQRSIAKIAKPAFIRRENRGSVWGIRNIGEGGGGAALPVGRDPRLQPGLVEKAHPALGACVDGVRVRERRVDARQLVLREVLAANEAGESRIHILAAKEMRLDAALVEAVAAAQNHRVVGERLAVEVTDGEKETVVTHQSRCLTDGGVGSE